MIKEVGIKQENGFISYGHVSSFLHLAFLGVVQVNKSRAYRQTFLILKSKSAFYEPNLVAGTVVC